MKPLIYASSQGTMYGAIPPPDVCVGNQNVEEIDGLAKAVSNLDSTVDILARRTFKMAAEEVLQCALHHQPLQPFIFTALANER